MTAEQLKEELDLIGQCRRMWFMFDITPETPSVSQFQTWLRLHNSVRIVQAISKTSQKSDDLSDAGNPMSDDHAVRFMSSVMNAQKTIEEEEQENTNEAQQNKNS